MPPSLLVTDDYEIQDSRPGWGAFLKKGLLRWLIADARRVVRQIEPREVLASPLLADAGREDASAAWFNYKLQQVAYANRADFAPLHEFADEVVRLAAEGGEQRGLVYRDIPLILLLEARWIDPFYNSLLVYADMIADRAAQIGATDIHRLEPDSAIARVAADWAASQNLGCRTDNSLPARLLSQRMRPRPPDLRGSYGTLRKSFLRLFPARANGGDGLAPAAKPCVLVIGTINRTVQRIQAALPVFLADPAFDLYLLALDRVSVTEEIRRAGVPCSYAHEWLSREEAESIAGQVTNDSGRGWAWMDSQAPERLSHRHRGIPLYPYARPLLRASVEDGGAHAALCVEIAHRVLERVRPRLVLCFEDAEISRAFTLPANRRGIPTLAYYNLSPDNCSGLLRRSQQWMAVSGSFLHRSYARHRNPAQMRIVGDTLCDRVLRVSRPESRRRLCQSASLDAGRPIVGLLSTWPAYPVTTDDIRVLFQKTADAVRRLDARLIVKAHPLQKVEHLKQWMRDWGVDAPVVQDCDLLEFSAAADLVTAPVTTAVFQTLMARTPVLCIQPRSAVEVFEPLGYDYLKGKGVVFVSDEEDPLPFMQALLRDPAARQAQIEKGLAHAAEHSGPLDGRASERLRHFIEEILKVESPL